MSGIWLPFGADGAPATVTIDGVAYRVLRVDSDGHLQVDALSSALPSGAATAARQDTMITALQLIDDLRNALAAVATDQLRADVISSALPTDASTETTLASILAKLDVALSTRALESGGNLASILAKLDVALSTRALEAGGNLASILAKLDVALSTRALEDGGNLASILAKLDVALSTRALEAGGNLASIKAKILALLWGYTDIYAENKSELDAVAGSNTLILSPVPTDELWVVNSIVARDYTSAPSGIALRLYDGTTSYALRYVLAPGANVNVEVHGNFPLKAGWAVNVSIDGCTIGDDLYVTVTGYKMAVA